MANVKFSDTGFEVLTVLNGDEMIVGLNSDLDGNAKWAASTMKDFVKAYDEYTGLLSYDGTTFTVVPLVNDFPGVTFTPTNPSNGVYRFAADSAVFTVNKTVSPGSSFNNAGQPYFVNGSSPSTTLFNFSFRLHDGTQTGTPAVSGWYFEIRVYR